MSKQKYRNKKYVRFSKKQMVRYINEAIEYEDWK